LIVAPSYVNHWKPDMPAEIYHADRDSVSSTALRKILKSPKSFYNYAIEGVRTEPTDAMKFGTLVHQVILEGADFLKKYVVAPPFVGYTKDGRESSQSKEAREAKAAWYAEQAELGSVIVTQQEFDDIRGMLDAIIEHPDAFTLLKDGVTEVSGYYRDPETGILCRIRPDFYSSALRAIVDLKTTQDVSEEEFARSIWNYRYDFQMAMYGEGVSILEQVKVEFHAFIAIEKVKPYEVAVYHADATILEKGAEDYHRALRRLETCIKTNEWPGYQRGITNIALPSWALNR
jgi:hypothetical protein